jgi:hypothetical protein
MNRRSPRPATAAGPRARAALVLPLLLAGCQTLNPRAPIDETVEALRVADQAGADRCAPIESRSARRLLGEARERLAADDDEEAYVSALAALKLARGAIATCRPAAPERKAAEAAKDAATDAAARPAKPVDGSGVKTPGADNGK